MTSAAMESELEGRGLVWSFATSNLSERSPEWNRGGDLLLTGVATLHTMCTLVWPEFKSIRSGLRHQIGLMNYYWLKYLVGDYLGPQKVAIRTNWSEFITVDSGISSVGYLLTTDHVEAQKQHPGWPWPAKAHEWDPSGRNNNKYGDAGIRTFRRPAPRVTCIFVSHVLLGFPHPHRSHASPCLHHPLAHKDYMHLFRFPRSSRDRPRPCLLHSALDMRRVTLAILFNA
jgi:hypothetical protein